MPGGNMQGRPSAASRSNAGSGTPRNSSVCDRAETSGMSSDFMRPPMASILAACDAAMVRALALAARRTVSDVTPHAWQGTLPAGGFFDKVHPSRGWTPLEDTMSTLGPVTRALLLPWRTKGRAVEQFAAAATVAVSTPARTGTLAPAAPRTTTRMTVQAFLTQRLASAERAYRNHDDLVAATENAAVP